MQSTSASASATTLKISPASLAAAFATVPDPRRQASTAYPLGAILALAVAALLSAPTSVLAMAEWGRRQSPDLLAQLGFADGRTPCQSTLHRLFAKLDGAALAAVLGDYFATHLPAARADALQGVALDGKAQRGRYQYDGAPVHALTAFCHHHGVVLAQAPLASGEDKAEAELTMAPALVARLSWPGRVLTGDAFSASATCVPRSWTRAGTTCSSPAAISPPSTRHSSCCSIRPPTKPRSPCRIAGRHAPSNGGMDGSPRCASSWPPPT